MKILPVFSVTNHISKFILKRIMIKYEKVINRKI